MRIKFTHLRLLAFSLFLSQFVVAQTDYRSAATGNWNSTATWEYFDGIDWLPAVAIPTSADGNITIRNTHTVTLTAPVTADQLVVDAGGTLSISLYSGVDPSANNLTLNNGTGDDLIVNGTLFLGGFNTINGSGTVQINNIFNWRSGYLAAVTTTSLASTVNLEAQSFPKNINANLTVNGTFNWATGTTNGGIGLANNAVFTNNGTINEQFQSNRGFISGSVGSFVNNGTFNKTTTFPCFNNSLPVTNNGTIKGIGDYEWITGFTNPGIIAPGSSPGSLTVNAAALNTNTPTIQIEVNSGAGAGVGHDQLAVNGSANLSGTNLVVIDDPAAPSPLTYIIMTTTGAFTGSFSSVTLPPGYILNYTPGGNSISVTKDLSTLPVVWGDFTAIENNGRVRLDWSTLQEANVEYFSVEYSTDGRNFSAISTLPATGNSSITSSYTYTHSSPNVSGNNFYRIKQVDFDGKSTYSGVRTVRFDNGNVIRVLAYPNPVRDILQISVQTSPVDVLLIDMSGNIVKRMLLQPGFHPVNVQQLPAGIYQLSILDKQERKTVQQIIKL